MLRRDASLFVAIIFIQFLFTTPTAGQALYGCVSDIAPGLSTIADRQCWVGYKGYTAPVCVDTTTVTPLPEGAECARQSIGDHPVFALECEGIKDPVVISKCDRGKCVAKIGCDGKPLTGLPDAPVDNGSGSGTGSGGGTTVPSPTPTTPSTGSPIPLPPIDDAGGTSGGGSGGGTASPDPAPGPATPAPGPNPVPAPQPSPASPGGGTTYTPVSVDKVSPGTSGSKSTFNNPAYSDGVFSGGNPFYSGSTFGGDYTGGSSVGNAIGATLIGSVVSFFTNFFLGQLLNRVGTFGVPALSNTNNASQPMLLVPEQQPQQQNMSTQKPQAETNFNQVFIGPNRVGYARKADGTTEFIIIRPDGSTRPATQDEVDAAYDAIRRSLEKPMGPVDINEELKNLSDRYQDATREVFPLDLSELTEAEKNRESTNVEDRRNDPPVDFGGPNWSLIDKAQKDTQPLVDVYRFVGTNGSDAALPLNVPDWWTPELKSSFAEEVRAGYAPNDAYQRARTNAIEGAFAGLANGRLAPGSPEVETARKLLEQDLTIAKQERDRAYDASPLGFAKMLDRIISISPGQLAVDRAEARLTELVRQEGYARLGMFAGSYEPPVVTPPDTSLVKVVDTPLTLRPGRTFDLLDPRTWFDAGTTDVPGTIVPGPAAPLAQTEQTPQSGLLRGLSAIGNRVLESVRSAYRFAFGIATPPDTTIPVVVTGGPDTPSLPPIPAQKPDVPTQVGPPTQQAPTQNESPRAPSVAQNRSGELLQSSINWWQVLMGGVRGALAGLFANMNSGSGVGGATAPVAPVPVENAAAFITVAPSLVSSGDTSRIAWSSMGTVGCAVVDAELAVVDAGGQNGATTSPILTETTRFGVICEVVGGGDKVVNETLVVVKGSTSTPSQLFSDVGRVSRATGISNGGQGTGSTGGSTNNPQPIDVRTCDPTIPIDAFIRCLCIAEPNPAGCSLVR